MLREEVLNVTEKQEKNKLRVAAGKTREELSEAGRKGGIASGESKRRNKTFKEAMLFVLDLPAMQTEDEDIESLKKQFPDLTNRDIMAVAMAKAVIKDKNVRAYIAARDTTGELPEQTVNVKNETPLEIKITTVD